MAGESENCLEAGMDDYIVKPIDPGILVSTLNTWIKPEIETTDRYVGESGCTGWIDRDSKSPPV